MRPCVTFERCCLDEPTKEWTFSREPILARRENFYELASDIDSGEETDPEDHESNIQSSWHHRALLGDENRLLYTDFFQEYIESLETYICDTYDERVESEDEDLVAF